MRAPSTYPLRRLSDDRRAAFLNAATHVSTLVHLIGRSLAEGDPESALALADRRCRIAPPAGARDYLLRAEAARRAGDPDTARAAIARAQELDPTDVSVNLGAVAMLPAAEAREAARAIVDADRADAAALAAAAACLVAGGERIVGRLTVRGRRLVGWVAWPSGGALRMEIAGRAPVGTVRLEPDPGHALSGPGRHAASLALDCSDPGPFDVACFAGDDEAVFEAASAPVADAPLGASGRVPSAEPNGGAGAAPADLTVIVPVYADFERTVACLDSLAVQTVPDRAWATIVVDDCSPDRGLVADLARRERAGAIRLVTNDRNLGFAGSVAAAALHASGDLLLLNADTLLPPGALARLCLAAQGPGVGTVTPLSNNGELVSFPRPNAVNDLPPDDVLAAWDRAAAADGAGVVDVPTGIGFCLLVRRACWDAVGGLSRAYGRGYYEDVDLCLRARERGFRNVCATGVVVGHAGSRSFGGGKRSLVVRNQRVLEARFPGFQREYAAFLLARPLRPALDRIERRLAPSPHPALLVTARPVDGDAAALRAAELVAAGAECLSAELGSGGRGAEVRLRSTGLLPQSLAFALDDPGERAELLGYLRAAGVERAELLEPEACRHPGLLAVLDALGAPLDLHCSGPVEDPDHLLRLARSGGDIVCRDPMAYALAAGAFPTLPLRSVPPRSPPALSAATLPRRPSGEGALAVLCPAARGDAAGLIAALAGRADERCDLRVLGVALDDLTLMGAGPVFVTGAIAPDDLPAVLRRLAPRALVSPYRAGLFDRLEAASLAHPCPRAFFDWSGGRYRPAPGDLALDPALADAEAAAAILGWFATLVGAAG